MISVLRLGDGSTVRLGAVLARAGEGTIYEIAGRPDWVAKIFHPELKALDAKRSKVAAMVTKQPDSAKQSDGFVVLTWPLQVVEGEGLSGYIMARIDTSNAVEIHSVSNPTDRMNPLPGAPQWTPHVTWHHLVSIAANLCLAVETVHKVDAVIGDFQERNILVNDTTRVTLVDCDSMQFTDPSGRQFLCGVGRPEFTAPELAGLDLSVTARGKPSDLFALAVHIHLLLMAGNHPFQRGKWCGQADQPDALTLAKTGQWAGGPGSALHSHPLAPSIGFLPPQIQTMFIRAFTDGARNPEARPTAAEWRQALHAIRVGSCARGHQIPIEAPHCPWCVIDDERADRRARRESENRAAQAVYPVRDPRTTAQRPPETRPAATASTSYGAPAVAASGKHDRRILLISGGIALAVLIGIVTIFIARGSDTEETTARRTTTSTSEAISGDATATTTRRSTSASTSAPPPRPDASKVALNVNRPITQPACDGAGIVVLSNAVTPGRYDAEIQRALDRFPDASYLRTDHSCPSLRQVSDNGTPIYAVYRPAGRSPQEVCAAVNRAGGDAYGKWLDTVTDPKFIIPC